MSQEAEEISNYESKAVQKNKEVMKSKFAERYERMQDSKNNRGEAANFNTFVTNAVDKPGLTVKEKIIVASVEGSKEIKVGEIATYTIAAYKGGIPDEAYKKKIRWSVYIDGKQVNRIRILGVDKTEREESTIDIYEGKKKNKEFILYAKITPAEDKLEIKFSKWLDGKNVKIEAHIGLNSFDSSCQVDTTIIAKPEILSINWVNAKEKKVKHIGYDQDVFLQIETLGLKGKEINIDILDYDKGGEDDKLDWGANNVKITGRKTLKQFPIKKKTDYGLQQEDENKLGLDLYAVVNSTEPLENCEDKYATYLDLNPDEKIIDAYFAEERKKEVQKGEEKEETPIIKEEPKENIYIVEKGDGLASIAKKYGIADYNDIKTYNELIGDTIIKGQALKIPPKKEKEKLKEEEKDTKTIIYYQKIDTASLGSEVHLTAETQNLEGKKVVFTVFEKDPILLTTKDTPLPLLIGDEEKTEVEATVSDGKAQVKVVLKRKEYKAQKEWQDILNPPEECINGVWYDTKKDQDVKMADNDIRIITEPERYTPAIKYQEKKKTYLWLQFKCEGDQLDFDQPFLKKSGGLEIFYDVSYNPWPVKEKFKNWTRRIDSGVEKRNVKGLKTASKNHKGLDINFSGGGNTDYGAPIFSTHDGYVSKAKDSTSGTGGRYLEVSSKDDKFMTRYLHLSKIDVEEGQNINKGQKIGELGASYLGQEIHKKMKAHLHYEIRTIKNIEVSR